MTADAHTPPSASGLTPRALIVVGLGGLAGLGVVVAAIGPRRVLANVMDGAHARPHAPDLALIARAPPVVQLHLAAVLLALAIGVVLLVGVKGSTLHRALGWAWVLAMMTGAASSLFIRMINHGHLSLIHLLSGWTVVALPMGVAFARRHQVRPHARMMTGLFTGGLILAGAFAFMPGRLMWSVFFG